VALDVRLCRRDEITTQLKVTLRVVHRGFPATPTIASPCGGNDRSQRAQLAIGVLGSGLVS